MTTPWQIGVFTSIDAGLGVHLDVAQELGIPTVQVHSPHGESRNKKTADDFLARLKAAGITLTCVFTGFEGESYADIATTARTVGLVPEATRKARAAEMKAVSDFAKLLNCNTVGLHIGFVPERNSASYKDLIAVTQDVLDHVAKNGQNLHLETGQESADHLLEFLHDVNRPNLFINFDPANMILYGTGDPIEALKKVGKYVRSVHCKDAKWAPADQRGKAWGTEVPLGEGDVGMENYLRTLKEIGYLGPLTIEREIAHDRAKQKADIGTAAALLQRLRAQIL
jgi:sugar phosphate isomerase/epimerase